MAPDKRHANLTHGLCLFSLIAYLTILHVLERFETVPLFALYGFLFGVYLWLYRNFEDNQFRTLLLWSVLFRVSLLFGIPNLSDDVFRFIWDGRLLAQGINPFAHLPSEYLESGFPAGLDQELYLKLNSADYYTIYPPVAQLTFWIGTVIFPNSILGSAIVMKLFLLLAEIGNLILMPKLLEAYRLPRKHLFLYALNPLVIIELTGNLHAEGLMLFFILFSAWLLLRGKSVFSAASFGLSVATKLVPVIFLPLFLRRDMLKKVLVYYLLIGVSIGLIFTPLLSKDLIEGLGSSFSLYFQKFEFNASVYYVVREIGYWVKGYNIIATSGKYMAASAILAILLFVLLESPNKKNFLESSMWVLFIYLLFATTLHPWYIITLIGFSVFSSYRFPVVWSLTIFLTYSGYTLTGFSENLYLVTLEYLIVFGYLLFELKSPNLGLLPLRHPK